MAIQAKDALEMLKSAKPNSGDDTSKDDFNKVYLIPLHLGQVLLTETFRH